MRAIIEGQMHELLGETSPQQIHDLYHPDLPVPMIIETYPGEITDLYRANGRTVDVGVLCSPWLTVGAALDMIGRRPIQQLGKGVLLGPYLLLGSGVERPIASLGLWLPPKLGLGM